MMSTKRERLSGPGRVVAMTFVAGVTAMSCTTGAARAGDWGNAGGNEGRNCVTSEISPDSLANLAWTYTDRTSRYSWQPVLEGSRMFVVRQSIVWGPEYPPGTASPVVAIDLETGAELWHKDLPLVDGDWSAWIA